MERFQGSVPLLPHLCLLSVPKGGGVGYVRKALGQGYLEHPGFACCTDDMCDIFVHFGRCLCCLLPPFVNRQSPCPHTNSRNGLLHLPMHHRNLWFAKEHALAVQIGCRLLVRSPPAKQKSLALLVRSNLHANTRSTRFYPLLRPPLLQPSFGIKRLTPPRLRNMNFWQPASTLVWSKM